MDAAYIYELLDVDIRTAVAELFIDIIDFAEDISRHGSSYWTYSAS